MPITCGYIIPGVWSRHGDPEVLDKYTVADLLNCRNMAMKDNIVISDDDNIPHIFFINRRMTEMGLLEYKQSLPTYKHTHYTAKFIV